MDDHIPTPSVRRAVDQEPYLIPDDIQNAIDRHEARYVALLMLGFEHAADRHFKAWESLLAEIRERLDDVEGSPHP